MHDKRLFGREQELKYLADAVANPQTRLAIVRGASGAGKTALVQPILAASRQSGHIVGEAKYSEESYSKGFAPIMAALSQAVGLALDLLYDPVAGSQSFRAAMGGQMNVLRAAGFEVPTIGPGSHDSAVHASGGAVQINEAVYHLFRWLRGFGVPIVIFIDDWQRAPADALSFPDIATRDDSSHLGTVILAERTGARPADDGPKAGTVEIELGPLETAAQIGLLSATLRDDVAGTAVFNWLGAATTGLPFDLIEAARALKDGAAINDRSVDGAAAASINRSDIAHAIARRLLRLSNEVRTVATAFAFWGDRAPVAAVAEAVGLPISDVTRALAVLDAEGIVETIGGEVRLIHDRIRSAIIDTAGEALKRDLLVRMAGRLIGQEGKRSNRKLALKLRLAAGLDETMPHPWRDLFATEAAACRSSADITAADAFAEAAWTLRQSARPDDAAVDALLLREAALAAAGRYDKPALRERIEVLIDGAKTDRQIGFAYETAIIAATRAGELHLAWHWARQGLKRLGAGLPATASRLHMYQAILVWRLALWVPPGTPPPGHTADTVDPLSRIVHFASVTAYSLDPAMALLMGLRTTARARRLGYRSPYWRGRNILHFAALSEPGRAAREAVELAGEVARSPFARAATLYRVLYFGLIWTQPLATLRGSYKDIFETAVAEGDLVFAALAIRNSLLIAWRTSPTLDDLDEAIDEAREKAVTLGDANALRAIAIFADTSRALRNPAGFDIDHRTAPWRSLDASPGSEAPVLLIEILGLRGDWNEILSVATRYRRGRISLSSHPGGVVWRFNENLARLKLGLAIKRSDLRYIHRAAHLNPADHLVKLRILEAEVLTRKGRKASALDAYAAAVAAASAGSSRLESGVAAECAADAASRFGETQLAQAYTEKARAIWAAWGARAKLKDGTGAPVSPQQFREQLAQAASRVDLAMRSERAKNRFLAEVSHELRTPLQGMQSILDLASEGKTEFDLKQFREVFTSLKTVVDDLTDLGALGGGAPLRPAPLSMIDLVRSECSVIASAATGKGLQFNLALPAEDVCIDADGARIRQVLRNVMSNALKYTPSGGINVQLDVKHDGIAQPVTIHVRVEDTGPGLSEHQLVSIFEPFDRGQRTDDAGLGLGLALSRRIAERMKGSLTASNGSNGGAIFDFRFQAHIASEQPLQEKAASRAILLVEDVALSRKMLSQVLMRAGHRVVEAETVREALQRLENDNFDVVLLDLSLPDGDGLSIMQTMKDRRLAPDASVFVLTAAVDPAIDRRALQLGAKAILRKPISADELRYMVLGKSAPAGVLTDADDDDIEQIRIQAREEIIQRSHALMMGDFKRQELTHMAHQLSGLAAQFGAIEIAHCADAIVRDADTSADGIERSGLRSALEIFESRSEGGR